MKKSHFLLSAVFLATLCASPDRARFKIVHANSPSKDSCTVAKTDLALLDELKQLGWQSASNDYPDIDFPQSVALIVTTKRKDAKPAYLSPSNSPDEVVLVKQAEFNGTGTLVLAVSTTANVCSIRYYANAREAGSLYSVNSASSDKPAKGVEDTPTLPSKTPPSF